MFSFGACILQYRHITLYRQISTLSPHQSITTLEPFHFEGSDYPGSRLKPNRTKARNVQGGQLYSTQPSLLAVLSSTHDAADHRPLALKRTRLARIGSLGRPLFLLSFPPSLPHLFFASPSTPSRRPAVLPGLNLAVSYISDPTSPTQSHCRTAMIINAVQFF